MIKKVSKNESRIKRHERIRKNLSGTGTTPRLSIYRSNTNTYAQIIDDEKGVTLVSASTRELNTKSNNIEACTALGKLIAEKSIKAGIEQIVFDRSGYKYHGRVKALADAAREAGLKF